jgi:hypothetical protein
MSNKIEFVRDLFPGDIIETIHAVYLVITVTKTQVCLLNGQISDDNCENIDVYRGGSEGIGRKHKIWLNSKVFRGGEEIYVGSHYERAKKIFEKGKPLADLGDW